MKKKIVALCLVAAMAVTAVVGGTLAYFTDTDAKDNTFTVGKVDITLNENFGDNDPNTPEKLMPATGSAWEGTLQNGITKEVTVTNNLGSEDAYVRVHIAIPHCLDNGNPDYDAGKNTLHFNYPIGSTGEGKWDWSKTSGAPYEGDYNYYETTIDGIAYNVYVITYERALKANETTSEKAINQVYLDARTSQEAIETYKSALGKDGNWHVLVVAEGVQAAGFNDAYTALNTAFGVPGKYDVDWSKAVRQ